MTTFTSEDRKMSMNAYELATELALQADEVSYHVIGADFQTMNLAAKMLRMQADEITALRKQLNEL